MAIRRMLPAQLRWVIERLLAKSGIHGRGAAQGGRCDAGGGHAGDADDQGAATRSEAQGIGVAAVSIVSAVSGCLGSGVGLSRK
jgi:hypothetical protein